MSHMQTPFDARLRAAAATIEQRLEALLDDTARPGEIARPERLMAAMRHAALAGGKRLRPFLALEATRLLGGPDEAGLRAGLAVELVHCYSLVHDDLPAMDDDDMRRGKPTVHKAFDDATAILVGDALLTLAFEVATQEGADASPAIRAALVAGLARASGLAGMVGGQMLDLAAEGRYGPRTLSEAEIRRLQAMKTGALLAFAAEAGAIAAGASAEDRARLLAYGRALGAAFQIADDILDREATAEALGKAVGKDAERGKGTLVDTLGMEAARAECDRLVAEAQAALAPFGERAGVLVEAARFTVARKA
ncbi:polyprenyl synthetase family protein [Salinarimonas ramus]|uniref:Probable farnesyl diphosphate synthase n=1 Tax=Salinarimonas ramus TaxID=690164 RepID=A0A917V258_9HYPH|nr:farnesyl diphosphate synthase [Salinarimonas ramus]GGK19810.1 geranylgeranyl pyrophosphate synthase [Salinarimonas ramus]